MSATTRTICSWGATGSSKTSQLYHRIKRVYEQTGKITRAVYADGGGGSPLIDFGLVDEGIVDLYDISDKAETALSTTKAIAEGYWYRLTATGKRVIRKSPEFKTTPTEWAKVGYLAFEGGTSIASLILRGIANSNNKKVAFGKSFNHDEGGYSFGGASMYHIGMVQNHVFDLVSNSRFLPVEEIYWSFHDGKGDDKNTKVTHLAPEIAGSAMNTKIGREFWDQLHLCHENVIVNQEDGSQITERRVVCYFKDHIDQTTGIPCMAKVRVLPELYPALLERWPNGGFVVDYTNGINELYDFVDKLKLAAKKQGKVWLANVQHNVLDAKPVGISVVDSSGNGELFADSVSDNVELADTPMVDEPSVSDEGGATSTTEEGTSGGDGTGGERPTAKAITLTAGGSRRPSGTDSKQRNAKNNGTRANVLPGTNNGSGETDEYF